MIETLLTNPWICSSIIVVGFVLLVLGADWLVDGASDLAKKCGISDLIIGLTVVAFGTSMPEFIVSTIASFQHSTEIAITNILGSNSINVFIILGLSAIIYPVASQQSCRRFDIPWSLLAGFLVLFFATYTRPIHFRWGNFGAFSFQQGFISGVGGVGLLICFIIFMWHSIHFAKRNSNKDETRDTIEIHLWKAILLIIVGLVSLIVGGEAIVKSATSIAHMIGVDEAVIGLTIVALGTSLPELATSCVAAFKHNSDLALGNVVGSNIFNVFLILGTSALIHPLPIYPGLWLDAALVTLASLMVMIFVTINKKHDITRWQGILLLAIYGIYLAYRLLH